MQNCYGAIWLRAEEYRVEKTDEEVIEATTGATNDSLGPPLKYVKNVIARLLSLERFEWTIQTHLSFHLHCGNRTHLQHTLNVWEYQKINLE